MKHVKYGPSRLHHYELCPKWGPSEGDTAQATEGTLLHAAVESGDLSQLENSEQVDMAIHCQQHVQEIVDNEIKPLGLPFEVHKEVRLAIRQREGFTFEIRGTADWLAICGDQGWLLDWKFGRIPVQDAKDNLQLAIYATAALDGYPQIARFHSEIVQPRIGAITRHTFKRTASEDVILRASTVIARVDSDDAKPSPSSEACMYCGNKGTCKALHDYALRVGEGLGTLPAIVQPNGLMVPEDRAKLQELSRLLEDWATEVRKANTAFVLAGTPIPGFDLRTKTGNTTITDSSEAIRRAMFKYNLTAQQVYQACSVSLADLVEVVVAKEGGSKAETRKQMEELLQDVINKRESITYLQKSRGKKNE